MTLSRVYSRLRLNLEHAVIDVMLRRLERHRGNLKVAERVRREFLRLKKPETSPAHLPQTDMALEPEVSRNNGSNAVPVCELRVGLRETSKKKGE